MAQKMLRRSAMHDKMDVIPVPCLKDNYAYLIVCRETREIGIVDPSESKPVLAALEQVGGKPVAILNTHHHYDHVGGNRDLCQHFADLKVYGYYSDEGRIPEQNVFLNSGDTIQIGKLTGTFSYNPGHTTGAITYYFEDAGFTGDTLFAAGCGRLFEGSPADMYQSLNLTIGDRDDQTKLYFGHEYTENNLNFALSVEPNNTAIQAKLAQVKALRAKGEFTTPTTLADEWQTNPFMRVDAPEILSTVAEQKPGGSTEPAEVLGVLRAMKDKF
jgi:hydroxyacylglutathione hydrolase